MFDAENYNLVLFLKRVFALQVNRFRDLGFSFQYKIINKNALNQLLHNCVGHCELTASDWRFLRSDQSRRFGSQTVHTSETFTDRRFVRLLNEWSYNWYYQVKTMT